MDAAVCVIQRQGWRAQPTGVAVRRRRQKVEDIVGKTVGARSLYASAGLVTRVR